MLGGELVQLDPLGEARRPTSAAVQAGDPQLVGSGLLDPRRSRPVRASAASEPVGVRGADRHPGLPVGELGQGALADQAAAVEDHDLVDELLDLGEDVAGDQHGPALVGQ